MGIKIGHQISFSLAIAICIGLILPMFGNPLAGASSTSEKAELDPSSIPKFVNELIGPPAVFIPTKNIDPSTGQITDYYSIIETEFTQQILPAYDSNGVPTGLPGTKVWGYGGMARDAITNEDLGFVRSTPSATIEATRGTPANVAWVNGIVTPFLYTMDPTIDPNNATGSSSTSTDVSDGTSGESTAIFPVTTTTHLHGGETSAKYDGAPYSWVTWNGLHGSDYYSYARTIPNAAVYHYDNLQAPGTLWFHDRSIGLTRSNVYSGLSGFYMLRDKADPIANVLPTGKYEIPLSIQDRNFYSDGSLKLPIDTIPERGPVMYWAAEFYGDVIMVNGLAWPNMNVDQGQYLFKILDGSNARWYDLSLSNGMPFTVIATDENYLRSAVTTTSFTIGPGERYDVLIDFSGYAPGTEIVLKNKASAPYAYGKAADANTGVIMKFTVGEQEGFSPRLLPTILNPTLEEGPNVSAATVQRTFTLKDFAGESGDLMAMLDGQLYKAPMSEYPKAGTTEIWRIIDATRDSHQMHISMVNFQLVSRQMIDIGNYGMAWVAANGGYLPFTNSTKNLDIEQYLIGEPIDPTPIERGWKDSIVVNPGEVITIFVRFSPADGRPSFSFDPTEGPTYIWYSNIFDHEENEMARQFKIIN